MIGKIKTLEEGKAMRMKVKANPFRCVQCGDEGILQVIKGKPYCLKDAEIKQGIREKNGLKKEGQ